MKIFKKYINPSLKSDTDNSGITIMNLGHNIHPPNRKYPDEGHPMEYNFSYDVGRYLEEYQIVYLSKGEGTFQANGEPPQKIGPGTILLLFPGVWHRFRPEMSTGWEEYWVGFKGAYAQYLLEQKCFNAKNPVIRLGFNQEFLAIFSKLIDTIESENGLFQNLSSFHLINMLGIVYTSVLSINASLSHEEKIIRKMQDELHRRWNEEIDFEDLSSSYDVSYSWFRKTFKAVLKTSPNQYLLMLKIRKSAEILKESNLPISRIAFECGFNSQYYFSKIFKQKMGFNPSDLRKNKI